METPERVAAILAALDFTPDILASHIGVKVPDARRIMAGKGYMPMNYQTFATSLV